MGATPCESWPSDVTDEEWAFVTPCFALMHPEAPQLAHGPREVVNALCWMVRAVAPWRCFPDELPPWEAVSPQPQRWILAGCFVGRAEGHRGRSR